MPNCSNMKPTGSKVTISIVECYIDNGRGLYKVDAMDFEFYLEHTRAFPDLYEFIRLLKIERQLEAEMK